MTTFELARLLLRFPPDTKVVQSFNWSPDVTVEDYTAIVGDPTVALYWQSAS